MNWSDYAFRPRPFDAAANVCTSDGELLARIQPAAGQSAAGYIARTYAEVIDFWGRFGSQHRQLLRDFGHTKEAIGKLEQVCREEIYLLGNSFGKFEALNLTFHTRTMIRQIAPQFFTRDIAATAAYYQDRLGFACTGTWQDPPVYAIVARDGQAIHFRLADPPTANPRKYESELLDAYIFVEDADALYAEFAAKGVEFTRGLGDMPWRCREFVVKDCDGRLLAFGGDL